MKRKPRPIRARWLLLTLVLFVLVALCAAQDQPPSDLSPEGLAKVNELVNVQKNLTKQNTPGAELRVVETDRAKSPYGTTVRYELFAKNLPADQKYLLGVLRIDQQLEMFPGEKTFASSGQVMDGPDDPVIVLAQAAKGEPYRLQLASKDGKYKAFTSVVPFPISAKDKACSIEAILLQPDAVAVLLQGGGFPPKTIIHVDTDSEGEKHSGDVRTNDEGEYSFLMMPYKKGVKKGEARVAVNSSDCHPELRFTWGKGTYQTE